MAVRRCARPVVTALVVLAGLGCRALRTGSSTAEDSTGMGADTIGRLLADSPSVLPDSPAVASPAGLPRQVAPVESVATFMRTRTSPPPKLSPQADSVAQYLVFDPIEQSLFLAAKRGKRLLVDIGRVDMDVQHDKQRAAAYLQAVKALSPIPVGTPVRVYEPWGIEDDSVSGFASWNNRVVATLALSRHLDSLVRHAPAAYAAVERTDTAPSLQSDSASHDSLERRDTAQRIASGVPSAVKPSHPDTAGRVGKAAIPSHAGSPAASPSDSTVSPDSCERDSVTPDLLLRGAAVRDSIDLWLRTLPPPPYDRLVNTERSQSTQVRGCFGNGNRLAVVVDLRAGANEWIRERAVLIDTLGRVTNLKVYDYRFKAHDFLAALDPNGGGTDGIVARGLTQGEGGIVILALEPGSHLTRWVAGFAWEAR